MPAVPLPRDRLCDIGDTCSMKLLTSHPRTCIGDTSWVTTRVATALGPCLQRAFDFGTGRVSGASEMPTLVLPIATAVPGQFRVSPGDAHATHLNAGNCYASPEPPGPEPAVARNLYIRRFTKDTNKNGTQ